MPLVFVVDDDKNVADSLASVLRVSGFTTETFYEPLDALKRTEQCKPDMLLSDVMMPDMDGYTLALLMKVRYPECGVLLFSGSASAVQHRCVVSQASGTIIVDVLPKPMDPAGLITRIRALLGFN